MRSLHLRLYRCVLAGSAGVWLAACGDSSGPPDPRASHGVVTREVQVVVAPDLAPAAMARVARVLTVMDGAAPNSGPGTKVARHVAADAPEALVVAVDAQGAPLLAGLVESGADARVDAAS